MKYLLAVIVIILCSSFVLADFSISPPGSNLGAISAGSTKEVEVTIQNTGAEDIVLSFPTQVAFSGANDSIATVSGPNEDKTLAVGASQTYKYTLQFASVLIAGTYTGPFTITDNLSATHDQNLAFTVDSTQSLEVITTAIDFGEVYNNQTSEATIKIKNTGTTTLANIKMDSTIEDKFKPTFDQETISSLGPNEEKDIKVSIFMPNTQNPQDDLVIGNLEVTADGIPKTTKPGFFIVDVKNYLVLKKVRVEIEGSAQSVSKSGEKITEKAEPREKVRIDVEVENIWKGIAGQEIEIEDVEAEIRVIDIDQNEDDIEYDSDAVTLNFEGADKDHTFIYEFNIPVEADTGEYTIEVKVNGQDELGTTYSIQWDVLIEVERRVHDLVIDRFEFNPAKVSCQNTVIADITIANLGRDTEDYVRYILQNDDLNIKQEKSRFEVSADEEDDEYLYRESIPLDLSNAQKGNYPVELLIYRDFDIAEDRLTVNLQIDECGAQNSEPEQQEEQPEQNQPEPVENTQEPEQEEQKEESQPVAAQVTNEPVVPSNQRTSQPIVVGSIVDDSTSFGSGALYLSIMIAMLFVVLLVLLGVLVVKAKAKGINREE